MARYMLSDLSFDDYLEAGGWRGYAQKAAKDAFRYRGAFVARPLEEMLDAEQARLLALENTTADDFRLVVAIQRQLGKLKRHLKFPRPTSKRHAPLFPGKAIQGRLKELIATFMAQENMPGSAVRVSISLLETHRLLAWRI